MKTITSIAFISSLLIVNLLNISQVQAQELKASQEKLNSSIQPQGIGIFPYCRFGCR